MGAAGSMGGKAGPSQCHYLELRGSLHLGTVYSFDLRRRPQVRRQPAVVEKGACRSITLESAGNRVGCVAPGPHGRAVGVGRHFKAFFYTTDRHRAAGSAAVLRNPGRGLLCEARGARDRVVTPRSQIGPGPTRDSEKPDGTALSVQCPELDCGADQN